MRKYSSYILFLLLAVFVAILYTNGFGPLEKAQRSLNDYLCSFTADDDIRPNVITITIDRRAQKEFGPWPWNHDLVADLVAATAAGEPKAIVVGVDLSASNEQDSAGYTTILADELSYINNVVLPYDISLAGFRSNATSNPEYLFNYSVSIDNPLGLMSEEAALVARKTFLPAEKLLETNPLLGFDYSQPDHDRILRHQPLVVHFEGYYYPFISLIAAAAYHGVQPSDISISEGREIRLGHQTVIPINEHSEYFINFPPPTTITNYSAADILSEKFNRTVLAGRLVLIGLEDVAARESFATPVAPAMSKLQIQAAVAENIVNNDFLRVSTSAGTTLLVLLALGVLFAFLLPQMTILYRVVIICFAMIILVNVNYFLFSSFRIIPETVYVALELLLFLVACPMLDSTLIKGEAPRKRKDLDDLFTESRNRRHADRSEELVRVPARAMHDTPEIPANAATTVIDYAGIGAGRSSARPTEAMPMDHAAINIDSPIDYDNSAVAGDAVVDSPGARQPNIIAAPDIQYDSNDALVVNDPTALGASAADAPRWDPAAQTPTNGIPAKLGRYQISGALGKGAMGLVYKGVDPAINRPVALKTIRLDFVSDPEEMKELKERLHREAQAAGKLSHPNIVTIYDVGSDGPLQYIAMEYLEGRTLEDMIKKKTKFNYRIIAEIIMQICSALQYAHEMGIVHRDIKPANIMVLKDYRVKVMDYGIARIDTSSMTKTGIAMGTPNYISPEQLKGQKSDHRADLFSLGVVMYEMLLGKRPFKGENITSLIYTIINHEPDKPSDVNPQIPLLFDHIIMKALKKDPAQRYQRAAEIAFDLKDFVESFAPGS